MDKLYRELFQNLLSFHQHPTKFMWKIKKFQETHHHSKCWMRRAFSKESIYHMMGCNRFDYYKTEEMLIFEITNHEVYSYTKYDLIRRG